MTDQHPVRRFWGRADPHAFPRFANEIPDAGLSTDGTEATFRIYGPIDDWGEWWGVSATEVTAALDALPATVTIIHIHLNSPGGLIFEGIAIKNALANHPARIVVHVDGIAASIASVIAVAADELVMGLDTHLMIHDGSTYAHGNAADLRSAADVLDTLSGTISAAYARKAGGTPEEWRAVMQAETWYTAEAAVEAGLADRVAGAEEAAEDPAAAASFDLSGIRAVLPETPEEPAAGDEPAAPESEAVPVSHAAARLRLALAASMR